MHHNSDYHHSPLVKWVSIISIVVSTLAAIRVGLIPFGYDPMAMVEGMPGLATVVAYFVGICGIIGLIMIIMYAVRCCSDNHHTR